MPGEPYSRKMALHVVKKNLFIEVKGSVDLVKKEIAYEYKIEDKSKKPEDIDLVSPFTRDRTSRVEFKKKSSQSLKYSDKIAVTSLTKNTMYTRFRPYILIRDDAGIDKLVLANYSADIRLVLPDGSRIIKSTAQFRRMADNSYQWRTDRIRVLPPLHVWYTTAAEKISVEKQVTGNRELNISIKVRNESLKPANNILLTTQFPNTVYRPIPDRSDGEFLLEQEVMIRWKAVINRVQPGGVTTVKLSIVNEMNEYPVKPLRLLVYNKYGDLLYSD